LVDHGCKVASQGTDDKKELVLFEVRQAPYRQNVWPRYADGFVAALAKEYKEARKYNSSLEEIAPRS